MSMRRSILIYAALLCTSVAALLSGCHTGVPAETADHLIGEEYPDAGKYRAGTFTYSADEVKAVEVYWRSGEVDIRESDGASLRVTESGELPEESAMHYFLDGDVLRIRFCADGANIRVKPSDKRLSLEIPKGIELSVHTTAASITAASLEQRSILFASMSGRTELGAVTADSVDLSASSGSVCADGVMSQSLKCSTSSGSVELGAELYCGEGESIQSEHC